MYRLNKGENKSVRQEKGVSIFLIYNMYNNPVYINNIKKWIHKLEWVNNETGQEPIHLTIIYDGFVDNKK